jgi:serine/threonine protein kinase
MSIKHTLPMKFEIGQTVGGYEFLAVLETSESGVTYKVRNVLVKRLEALKVLPKELREDQQRVDRFLREVNIRARLTHPNIVTFYNAMPLEDQLVMTTELVEGSTIAQLAKLGPLPVKDASDYICHALSGLVYAHANGIVHRDISPSSMVVTEDNRLKLKDFGLAKMYADPNLTQAGTMVGSVDYSSPEQVKGTSTLDERTDIYSIGVILYELATGQKPFDSKSQFEVMQAHVEKDAVPPVELNPEISSELNNIILRALAKSPAERFQSAMKFRSALQDAALTRAEERSARKRPTIRKSASAETEKAETPAAKPKLRPAAARRDRAIAATAIAQSTTRVAQLRKVGATTPAGKLPALSVEPMGDEGPSKDPDILLVGALTFIGVALLFFAFLTLVT